MRGLEGGLRTKFLDELANSGVKYNPDNIVAITKTADGRLVWLENGKVVGTQRTRTIYEVMYEGKIQRVVISIGDNGFMVGANPKSIP